MVRIVAVIPARMAATRLPGKPLLARTGKPLIQHVYERVQATNGLFDRVVIATCDDGIERAARLFGAEVVRTRSDHATGTDRVAEAVSLLGADACVNVQGDEPEMEPAVLRGVVEAFRSGLAPVATAASPWTGPADPSSPSEVKVVVDLAGLALYFSRSVIPYGAAGRARLLRHIGVYAYGADFLARFASLPRTPLESSESLEQLRVLEHGHAIVVATVPYAGRSIDTPEEYEAFVARASAAGGGKR